MPKFKGTVCRTSFGFHEIEVEAKNESEARVKILDEAGDYEYSEKSSDYSIVYDLVERVESENQPRYTVYSQNGMHYVYDSIKQHTISSTLLGYNNEFKNKRKAKIAADKLNKELL